MEQFKDREAFDAYWMRIMCLSAIKMCRKSLKIM